MVFSMINFSRSIIIILLYMIIILVLSSIRIELIIKILLLFGRREGDLDAWYICISWCDSTIVDYNY